MIVAEVSAAAVEACPVSVIPANAVLVLDATSVEAALR